MTTTQDLLNGWYADFRDRSRKSHKLYMGRPWWTPPGYQGVLCNATYPEAQLRRAERWRVRCKICERKLRKERP